ncbi:hypothetical protein ABZ896_22970 [Streptomyces sp. NPDC047072]|uniref:hypothetical protein n=1 Tax=Streptomyces sp. NPDC047072 TaxID=3154809 RepID=UPI0033D7C012
MDASPSPFGLVVTDPANTTVPPAWTNWLLLMVPLFIADLRDVPDDLAYQMGANAGDVIASHADDAQHGGENRARARNAIAKSLALLARADGGVTALGIHACLKPHAGCPGRFNAAPPPTPEAKT